MSCSPRVAERLPSEYKRGWSLGCSEADSRSRKRCSIFRFSSRLSSSQLDFFSTGANPCRPDGAIRRRGSHREPCSFWPRCAIDRGYAGLGAFFADHLQVRLPHVGTDKDGIGCDFFADGGEESLKGFDGSFLAHPEQASDAQIDLVNQRQVLMTFGTGSSSTPMASIWPRTRCSRPQVTTCSTASKTLSQEVRNASAVSFQDSRRAQRARKSM